MPSAETPQTFLECPVCDSEDCPPHIKLDVNEKECLVCQMQEDTVRIHEKHYLLLFEPSLSLHQSGKSIMQYSYSELSCHAKLYLHIHILIEVVMQIKQGWVIVKFYHYHSSIRAYHNSEYYHNRNY